MLNPIIVWGIIGALILAADNLQSKYQLKYGGYAAFAVAGFLLIGIMRTPNPADADYAFYGYYVVGQVVVFAFGCFVWKFILRDAAPKSVHGRKAGEYYARIIGQVADVSGAGMNAVSGGEVLIDGKPMAAKLAANSEIQSLKAGAKVQVQEVIGDTLIVAPYND